MTRDTVQEKMPVNTFARNIPVSMTFNTVTQWDWTVLLVITTTDDTHKFKSKIYFNN
jgi:hypothetical protein